LLPVRRAVGGLCLPGWAANFGGGAVWLARAMPRMVAGGLGAEAGALASSGEQFLLQSCVVGVACANSCYDRPAINQPETFLWPTRNWIDWIARSCA
jgi:hypothetical protein